MAEAVTAEFVKDFVNSKTQQVVAIDEVKTGDNGAYQRIISSSHPASMALLSKCDVALTNGNKEAAFGLVVDASAVENVIIKRAGLQDKMELAMIDISRDDRNVYYVHDASKLAEGDMDKYNAEIKKSSKLNGTDFEQFLREINLEKALLNDQLKGNQKKEADSGHGLGDMFADSIKERGRISAVA